jgi:hypothetical protein
MDNEGADPFIGPYESVTGTRRTEEPDAVPRPRATEDVSMPPDLGGSVEQAGEGGRHLPAPAVGQAQGAAPEGHQYDAHGSRGEHGRWQRGSSGNPRGRPPSERALSTILRKLLRAPAPGQEGMSAREALCLQLLTRALEGDMTAIRLVLEYTDGKPAQRVEGSMTVQMMAPFTSDEAVVAHAELAAWAGEDAETLGWGDAERQRSGGAEGQGGRGEGETEDEGPRTLAG